MNPLTQPIARATAKPWASGGRCGEVKEEADALSLLSAGGQEPQRLPDTRGAFAAHQSPESEDKT